MPAYTLVESADTLGTTLTEFADLGIDTEFMRERTFFSQLCLLQIGAGTSIYCVDPLAEPPGDTFWRALTGRRWILHSARQDIEVIYQAANRMPSAIFDTQIAAALLGMPPQMGYATLVNTLFDVDLPKTHTRANWAERPLPARFLDYAAEDVEYLLPAFEVLSERLQAAGRLEWALADSAALLDPALYQVDPGGAIAKLKGARNLRGRRRAVAEALAAWREREALRLDRPRQWILRDSVLVQIAERLPESKADLKRIADLPPKVIDRAGNDLLDAVRSANAGSTSYRPPAAPNESQKTVLKQMQKRVAEAAESLGIAAETIASRKELTAVIIDGERRSRLFEGWRRDLIGSELASLL
ncbi:MAG: ribonuclease D [Woeseiaceae bacterium]|nr:ribonuclease D [Woeseiaceae bacterium]